MNEIRQQLSAPFSPEDVEWRVSHVTHTQNGIKALVLAYITARGVMNRLDDVFGIYGWQDSFEVIGDNVKCRLSVLGSDGWITKEDVAPPSAIEPIKGAFSDALKQAAVKYGIGRYLYNLENVWVTLVKERPQGVRYKTHYDKKSNMNYYWAEPSLPDWALPEGHSSQQPEAVSQPPGVIDAMASIEQTLVSLALTDNQRLDIINESKQLAENNDLEGLKEINTRILSKYPSKADNLKKRIHDGIGMMKEKYGIEPDKIVMLLNQVFPDWEKSTDLDTLEKVRNHLRKAYKSGKLEI